MNATPPLPPPSVRSSSITISEFLPFLGRHTRLWRSRILPPVLAVTLAAVLMFWLPYAEYWDPASSKTYRHLIWFYVASGAALLLLVFYLVYGYSQEVENPLRYWLAGAITYGQCQYLYWQVYAPIFRRTLAFGDPETYAAGFGMTFLNFFISAGLCEELLKALPVLACLAIALAIRGRPGGVAGWLALKGPLDGLLMGVFSALVFTMWETLGGYLASEIGSTTTASIGYLKGMLLMLPRLLNSFGGHVGYSGIFGYFIGLAVLHPRRAVRLVLFGWVLSAALHALWNTLPSVAGTLWLAMPATVTLLLFLACLLQARHIDAPRIAAAEGEGSVLAVPRMAAHGRSRLGRASGLSELATAMERSIGVTGAPRYPAGVAAPAPVPPSGLSIGTGSVRYALAPGRGIDFAVLFPDADVPPGAVAIVEAGEGDAPALRNTGTAIWAVLHRDGISATVGQDGIVQPAPGMRIVLGAASFRIEAY